MKQLITDQLIEEYQLRYDYLEATMNLMESIDPIMDNSKKCLERFLDSLKALRQQEAQNVKDSYGDGLNAHRTNFCNRDDYFNQTFKQKEKK